MLLNVISALVHLVLLVRRVVRVTCMMEAYAATEYLVASWPS